MKKSMKRRRIAGNVAAETVLIVLSFIWLIPILWIVLQAIRKEPGAMTYTFFPQGLTLDNFTRLFNETMFKRWFGNTLLVAVLSCVLSTLLVLMVAYSMSRFRFKARKPFMRVALILNMFPGFMSMIAVYYILKAFGLDGQLVSLVLVYAGGAGLGFYVAKGFFDTVSNTLDEAARLDGCSEWQIFFKIYLPLCKNIVYSVMILVFIDYWNMVEQPLILLGSDHEDMYPLSIFLSKINGGEVGIAFAVAVIYMIPTLLIFLYGEQYLVEGIANSGSVKG